MSIKKTLLSLTAVAALAFAALPAVASAFEVELPTNHKFKVAGETTKLTTPSSEVVCTSVSGSGEFTNTKTGTVNLDFHGCKAAGTNCQSGATTGEIQAHGLPFHIVKLSGNKPGILITPNGTKFAAFKCAFGLVSIEVIGNGVVGAITSPEVGKTSASMTLEFKTKEGKQVLNEADLGTGLEHFELEAIQNGGAPESAGQDGIGTATFEEGEGTLKE